MSLTPKKQVKRSALLKPSAVTMKGRLHRSLSGWSFGKRLLSRWCSASWTRPAPGNFGSSFCVVARKNGKDAVCRCYRRILHLLDGEYGARIYFAAPKLEQAALCYDAYFQMLDKDPELSAMAKKRRSDVYIAESNSSARPMAFSAKKSDGLNISLCVADEIASWPGDQGLKFYEVIKSSFGARRQPLLFSISTAGYINEGIYDELMKRCTRFLLGDSKERRLAPFLYVIDDPDKWNDINELRKSNPNLGVSVSVDYLLEEIAVAEGSLSKKAEFLTKYCNIKQNSSQAWLSAQDVEKAAGSHLSPEDFRNTYCVGGIDLSRTTDLTACTAVIEKGGRLYVLAQFFLPAERLEEATARDGLPYAAYVQRGLLRLSGDNFVDYHDCLAWFRQLVEEYQIYPLKVGYDRYTAQYLVQEMQQYGFHMDDVFQGYNLTPVIRETEGHNQGRRILYRGQRSAEGAFAEHSGEVRGGKRQVQTGKTECKRPHRRNGGTSGRHDGAAKILCRNRRAA